VACSASVEGVAVPVGVQADQVEGDGGVHVFEVGSLAGRGSGCGVGR
jgi:hypothetical protein